MSSAAGGSGQAPTRPASPAAASGQAPTSAQVSNTTSPSSGQSGQAPTAIGDYTPPSEYDWKRFQQELEESRKDAAKYRDEIRKRDDASLSEQEKRDRAFTDLQTKASEYEASLQRLQLENAGLRLAPSLGIADPAAALALVQAEHAADIKYASDGKPENLEDLLKVVLKAHPVLAGNTQQPPPARQPAPNSGGATNPGRNAGNGGLTLEQIRAMPMRERMARMDEITAWEKAQRQQ